MKAAVFYGPGDIRIQDVETPSAGPGELLVRTELTLTCGTDVKMYRRGHPFAKPPLIIGHEFVGEVVEVGQGVTGFKRGQKVVSANSAPCHSCLYCKVGKENLCEKLDEAIIGFTSQGAYAEYVKIPARIVSQNTFVVPGKLPSQQVAILEPLACVVHGSDLVEIKPGDSVAIIGSGPIGLMHLQLAKLKGAQKIIVIDLVQSRLEVALSLGATHTISSVEGQVENVKTMMGGMGADIVIEAVGRKETWESAVKLTRAGGTALLFGGCPSGTSVSLDAGSIHYGELTIRGAFHHEPRSVRRAFELLCSGLVKAEPLVTHTLPLDEVGKALELMGRGTALKVAVTS